MMIQQIRSAAVKERDLAAIRIPEDGECITE